MLTCTLHASAAASMSTRGALKRQASLLLHFGMIARAGTVRTAHHAAGCPPPLPGCEQPCYMQHCLLHPRYQHCAVRLAALLAALHPPPPHTHTTRIPTIRTPTHKHTHT